MRNFEQGISQKVKKVHEAALHSIPDSGFNWKNFTKYKQ